MLTLALRRSDRDRGHHREILRLALPALGALAAEPLYILTDTAVVGHLGTDALGGLALASTVLLTGHSIFIFLAYGTTATVARLIGAGDERSAAHQAVQGMWLAAAIGLALTIGGFVGAPSLITALGGEGDIATNADVYLRISLAGVPALLVALSGTGYLRGLQDTRTPLLVAIASAVGNLLLELLLIYGLGFGIGASALSTVVAQYGMMSFYVLRVTRELRAYDLSPAPHTAAIAKRIRIGRDLFIRTVALRGSLTLATAVAARTGATGLGAHQITFEIWSFLALMLDAVAIAAQALIGRFLGADDIGQARQIGQRMLTWGLLAGTAMGAGIGALHSLLPRVFTPDAAVMDTAATLLIVAAVLQPLNGLVFVLDGLLIGAGDGSYLAVAMVIGLAVFAPAALAVLALDLSIVWLWYAIGLLMLTRLLTLWPRWRGSAWAVTGAAAL